jgi:hypothetical protein
MIDLAVTNQAWVYVRQSEMGTVIIAINNGAEPTDIPVQFGSEAEFRSLLGVTGNLLLHDGGRTVHLPAHSAEIYAGSQAR